MTRLDAIGHDAGRWLDAAVAWMGGGGIVAYPTDTYYGLAVDPCSRAAVDALFDLKGRDERQAIPLVAGSLADVEAFCGRLDDASARVARAFWPGPLSIVLAAPSRIAPAVHAGKGTIAVRVPDQALARALSAAWGGPVTSSSANLSGQPPARRVEALGPLADDARLLVIDGGVTPGGPPSTIVDARETPPVLVRAGAVAWSRVLESLHE